MEMELRSAQQAAYWRGRYQSRPCPRLSVRSTARYLSEHCRWFDKANHGLFAQRDLRAALPTFACEEKRLQINWPTNCKGLTSGYGSPKLL